MSENAEGKAKRDIIWKLLVYPWVYQTSIYYQDADDSLDLIGEMPTIRAKIRRAFPEDALFLKVGLRYDRERDETTAFETIFSLRPLPELKGLIKGWMNKKTKVQSRKISYGKRLSSARAIKRGRLHDLNTYFGKDKVNRICFLNRRYLPVPDLRLYEAFLEGATHPAFDDLE